MSSIGAVLGILDITVVFVLQQSWLMDGNELKSIIKIILMAPNRFILRDSEKLTKIKAVLILNKKDKQKNIKVYWRIA